MVRRARKKHRISVLKFYVGISTCLRAPNLAVNYYLCEQTDVVLNQIGGRPTPQRVCRKVTLCWNAWGLQFARQVPPSPENTARPRLDGSMPRASGRMTKKPETTLISTTTSTAGRSVSRAFNAWSTKKKRQAQKIDGGQSAPWSAFVCQVAGPTAG